MKRKTVAGLTPKMLALIFALILVLTCIGSFAYFRYHDKPTSAGNTSGSARTIYSKPISNPNVPGGTGNSSSQSGISSSKNGSNVTPTPQLPSGTKPATPVGEFVSDHKPNLNGHPAPNTESSTCTTTPGAQCQIQFTLGGTTKSLPAQTTDINGNTSWYWTLQSIGLSEGTWQVTATATNGSKVSATTDANKLVISP